MRVSTMSLPLPALMHFHRICQALAGPLQRRDLSRPRGLHIHPNISTKRIRTRVRHSSVNASCEKGSHETRRTHPPLGVRVILW